MPKLITFALILTVILSACSSKAASSGQAEGLTPVQGEVNALTGVTQLMVGTFKLEDTAHAVTAEQAAKLLPLWKAYRSLSRDSSSAPAEREALEKQIEETMTAEQLKAIAEMKLTRQDMIDVVQSLGLALPEQAGATGGSGQFGQGQQPPAGDMGGMPGGGALPPGEGPIIVRGMSPGRTGGTGGRSSGTNTGLSPAQRQTLQAQRISASVGSLPLLDALIKLLESKKG